MGGAVRAGPLYNRRDLLVFGLAGCACLACGGANAQGLRYELAAAEIASGTFGVFGARENFTTANGGNIVNTAFIAVPDGVVVIDSGPSRRYGEALIELIGQTLPGRPVIRVVNTHHHPDHFLGNGAFERSVLAASQGVIDNIRAEGDAFADNMYRLVGDWMRGTAPVAPARVLAEGGEDVGGRRFSHIPLNGHTSADLVIRDDETGVVFAGDLAFLERTPTTPHADLPAWRASIARLRALDRTLLMPGHGPADATGAALDQTADWLDWLDGTLRDAVGSGLTMNEAMALPIPARFAGLGVVREEFARSVVHLYPRLEAELFAPVAVER